MDGTHGNSLHVKRLFGMVKHLPINSPAYDASKEDNDPLTDDAASCTTPSSFSTACELTLVSRILVSNRDNDTAEAEPART
ncbi:hypothetical protein JB92DRAFT_3135917 [Gautieria morchelliformis]|nr:hypothetical protein JB92DRAFT_3135917 [Gautieria morchelliformis]